MYDLLADTAGVKGLTKITKMFLQLVLNLTIGMIDKLLPTDKDSIVKSSSLTL